MTTLEVPNSHTRSFHDPIVTETVTSKKQEIEHQSPTKLQIDSRGDDVPLKLDALNLDKNSSQLTSNPFVVPKKQDIFMLRDKERTQRKKARQIELTRPVWDKHTYKSRINKSLATTRKSMLYDNAGDRAVEDEKEDDVKWTLNVTRNDYNVDREDLNEYINKKREMFHVQYSLRVKKDEMKKLDMLASKEEEKLERAEQLLEDDATLFDEFLKENDRNSVEAVKIAEAETKAKLEKVQEIKKSNAKLMAIKSEISKQEELLKEYTMYKDFLEKLTPQEWKDANLKPKSLKIKVKEEKIKPKTPHTPKNHHSRTTTSSSINFKKNNRNISANRGSKKSGNSVRSGHHGAHGSGSRHGPRVEVDSIASREEEVEEEDSDDEEVKMYFTDPQQLLDVFQELEENNLSLITNSQETEEAMEEIKINLQQTSKKMSKQTEQLKSQIDLLTANIEREEEKAELLEVKCNMFNLGEFNQGEEDKVLESLNKKIEHVYKSCIVGDANNSSANYINSLQMLTSIENRLEELFSEIEEMPANLVEQAEKSKEKERRMRMREEKLKMQKLVQEERARKAMERSKANNKLKVGKRLVFRSEPPQRKTTSTKKKNQDTKKEEEELWFFT